jgi:DNA-binding CsgD family transcriptional regulator
LNSHDEVLTNFLDLLIQRPNANELLKALETDLLSDHKPSNATIYSLDSHNTSKEIYSNNSLNNSKTSEVFDSVLKSLPEGSNLDSLTNSKIGKSTNNDFIVMPISNGKSLKGFILVNLDCAQLTPSDLSLIGIIGKVCAFYLMNELPELKHSYKIEDLTSKVQLSARQLQIIHGFIEGKTNHELATDLGFSVSTIRHETMDIFRLLGASDRKEAAKIAQERNL